MANPIQSSKLVFSSVTQSQKSLPSTLTEKYILQFDTTNPSYLQVSELLPFVCTYIPDGDNWALPYVRQRHVSDTHFVCTEAHVEYISTKLYSYFYFIVVRLR